MATNIQILPQTKRWTDLWVAAGVNAGAAVRCHVAQDLRHLLEHGQTVDVDLQETSRSSAVRVSGEADVPPAHLCAELFSQVGEQVLVSVRSFAVEPDHVIRTLADPVPHQLRDALQTDLLQKQTPELPSGVSASPDTFLED